MSGYQTLCCLISKCTYMSDCLFICLLACLYNCMSVCLSAYKLSVCLSACLSIQLCVCLPAFIIICVLACLYNCLPVCLCVYLPACLPVSLFVGLRLTHGRVRMKEKLNLETCTRKSGSEGEIKLGDLHTE